MLAQVSVEPQRLLEQVKEVGGTSRRQEKDAGGKNRRQEQVAREGEKKKKKKYLTTAGCRTRRKEQKKDAVGQVAIFMVRSWRLVTRAGPSGLWGEGGQEGNIGPL